jgi:hypothetical protein
MSPATPIEYYRGGTNLQARRREVRFDPTTGLVLPERGISVQSRPDGLERFGGAYRVTNLPPELRIVQRGLRPDHYEIIPAFPMSFDDYQSLLNRISLAPA